MFAEKEPVDTVTTSKDVYRLVRGFGKENREHFVCVYLNGAGIPIGKPYVATIGLANKTLVHPREVFSEAIKRNAMSVILAHNHPSGNIIPSEDDRRATHTLVDAGKIIGIKVLDHLVFSSKEYYSFQEHQEI